MEHEIHRITGVMIRNIPPDGKLRTFKVGNREWYAIYFGDCGSFGCFSTRELYGWTAPTLAPSDGSSVATTGKKALRSPAWKIKIEQPRRQRRMPINEARAVAAVGAGMQDRGEPMTEAEQAQYIEALGVLIDERNRRKRGAHEHQ